MPLALQAPTLTCAHTHTQGKETERDGGKERERERGKQTHTEEERQTKRRREGETFIYVTEWQYGSMVQCLCSVGGPQFNPLYLSEKKWGKKGNLLLSDRSSLGYMEGLNFHCCTVCMQSSLEYFCNLKIFQEVYSVFSEVVR